MPVPNEFQNQNFPHGEDRESKASFPSKFEFVTIEDAGLDWKNDNIMQDFGYLNGFERGYNFEFVHQETGEISFGSTRFVAGSLMDDLKNSLSMEQEGTPFYLESLNGYIPTGRAIFRGYFTSHYDEQEREEYVEDASKTVQQYIQEHHLVAKEVIDTDLPMTNNMEVKEQEMEQEQKELVFAEEETKELTEEQIKESVLYRGLINALNSESYKNYCKTMNFWMGNGYSSNNCGLIMSQYIDRYLADKGLNWKDLSLEELNEQITEAFNSDKMPSFLRGFEQWKEYGRSVSKGGKGYMILTPVFASNKDNKTGAFFSSIRYNLKKQLEDNPNLEYASYKIGLSGYEILGYRNGLADIKLNDKVIAGKLTEEQFKNYIESNVVGKVVVRFGKAYVFDVKDTETPEYLYVKSGQFTKDELVLNDKGQPIRNIKTKEYKIKNSEKRISKFNPSLERPIVSLDDTKMNRLFEVLQETSEKFGFPVTVEEIKDDGTRGFCTFAENRIVISDKLNPTERCSVTFHEMAHSRMHGQNRGKMYDDRRMREVQAESVAFLTAQNFGIDTELSSSNYLAGWSKSIEATELKKSYNMILEESKKLLRDIQKTLKEHNLSMDLEQILEEEQSNVPVMSADFIKTYKEFVLFEKTSISDIREEATLLIGNSDDKVSMDILGKQISLCDKLADKLVKLDNALNELEKDGLGDKEKAELIKKVEKLYKQSTELKEKFASLSEDYVTRIKELKEVEVKSMKQQFALEPLKTIKDFIKNSDNKDYAELSDMEIQYIAKSKYLSSTYGRLIKEDMKPFMEKALNQVENIRKVKAGNGCFVEIKMCEQWGKEPSIVNGMVAHPNAINRIIEREESDIRSAILHGSKENEETYLPTSKCALTVYTETEEHLTATDTVLYIGDGGQKNLTEHLELAGVDIPVMESYKVALMETRSKSKTLTPIKENRKGQEKTSSVQTEGMTMEKIKSHVKKVQTEQKKEPSKDKESKRKGKEKEREKSR